MAILSQTEMFQFTLETIYQFPKFTRSQAKELICERLQLTLEEQEKRTSSGKAVYESRVDWAISWLNEAGYLERVERGIYSISEGGKNIINKHLDLRTFCKTLIEDREARRQAQKMEPPQEKTAIISEKEMIETVSPLERIDMVVEELQNQIAQELMNAIMDIEGRAGDTFFEKIVTDLLEKMGYGKGSVTPASQDGGIDGIIRTDPLGFNPIFIQAKRYKMDRIVHRPEIQGFAGALGAVSRGAFITTSSFSNGAIEFAKSYPHADIVLVNGKLLTDLMIRYNVGVSVEKELQIKQIDNNYFEL